MNDIVVVADPEVVSGDVMVCDPLLNLLAVLDCMNVTDGDHEFISEGEFEIVIDAEMDDSSVALGKEIKENVAVIDAVVVADVVSVRVELTEDVTDGTLLALMLSDDVALDVSERVALFEVVVVAELVSLWERDSVKVVVSEIEKLLLRVFTVENVFVSEWLMVSLLEVESVIETVLLIVTAILCDALIERRMGELESEVVALTLRVGLNVLDTEPNSEAVTERAILDDAVKARVVVEDVESSKDGVELILAVPEMVSDALSDAVVV